ncbi:uncharacterized protein YqgQ [Filibacter limicola]|uniref:Uncharacterized protein YqgQ n=1 Tax=Sporosarcina limicola TaxID=34101 RepID=A0A927MGL8_9BACL|nr:uncharacterized protein YqgQ [Sporosarcina limicola]
MKAINIEIQNLTKRSTLLGVESEANQLVYGYYKDGQSIKLQEDNLKVTEKEYRNIQEKYNEGLSAKGDVLRAKKGLREAELAVKSAKLKLDETTLQLNQKIGKELNAEHKIQILSEFSLLSSTEYDAEIMAKEMKDKHPSIVLIRKKLQEYKNILNRIDSLPNLDEAKYVKQLNGFEQQISNLTNKMDDAKTIAKEEELDKSKSGEEKIEIEAVHKKVSQEYNKARDEGSLSKVEEENYLKNISSFEKKIKNLTDKMDEADSEIQEAVAALGLWQNERVEVETAHEAVLKEYNKSLEEQRKAKLELKEYYANEIQKTEIELVKQERRLTSKVTQFATQFEVLRGQIKLAEEKVEEINTLYDQQKELYDFGEIIFLDVQKSQQSGLADQMELANYQLDYQILKEEFILFKNGYIM